MHTGLFNQFVTLWLVFQKQNSILARFSVTIFLCFHKSPFARSFRRRNGKKTKSECNYVCELLKVVFSHKSSTCHQGIGQSANCGFALKNIWIEFVRYNCCEQQLERAVYQKIEKTFNYMCLEQVYLWSSDHYVTFC